MFLSFRVIFWKFELFNVFKLTHFCTCCKSKHNVGGKNALRIDRTNNCVLLCRFRCVWYYQNIHSLTFFTFLFIFDWKNGFCISQKWISATRQKWTIFFSLLTVKFLNSYDTRDNIDFPNIHIKVNNIYIYIKYSFPNACEEKK